MFAPDIRTPSALPHAAKLQDGAFSLGRILGQGGFGITYLGSDSRLHRAVAVKEFFPTGCVRQGKTVQPGGVMDIDSFNQSKRQFLEEARALARFQYRNIVQVLTIFEENNTAYLVMELLKGKTLTDIVDQKGILPENQAVEYVKQLSEALSVVHNANLIHRDVKPDNAIVCEDGRVVLIDFGLKKQIENIANYGTRQLDPVVTLGTSGYAPPEQYSQLIPAGRYSDIYALGATLYFLLTKEVPVSALERLQGIDLLQPHSINSSVSLTVSRAVMKAMEMERVNRPQSAEEFLESLKGVPQYTASQRQPSKPSQSAKPGTSRKLVAHQNEVEAIGFSPDGSILASVGKDCRIMLWDVETGRLTQSIKYQKKLTSLSFSPNGEVVCTGSGDSKVLLWELKTGKLLMILEGHHATVNAVAFSNQGDTIVSASKDGYVILWDVATGKAIQNTHQSNTDLVGVAISCDGNMVASASYHHVLVWHIKTGYVVKVGSTYSGFNAVAFSPIGSLLMTGADDKTAKVWDMSTGELINNFSKHRGSVTNVAFTQDGRFAVSGSSNGIIKIWDVFTGEVSQTFKQDSWATKVAISPTGNVLASAGEYDRSIKMWSVRNELSSTTSSQNGNAIPLTPAPSRKGRRIHTLDDFIELWPAVLKRVKREIGVTAVVYLYYAKPVLLNDKYAVLEVENEFAFEKAREAARRLPFEQVINECLATPHRLLFRLHDPEQP